ncbi:MAG: HAD family hydrolase [Pseudomonadota bacterium]|jgi:HAD superfamily hydrolase (TIGR01509 family)
MLTPDLIIFDCDGVLVDSEALSCRCLSEVLATYGIRADAGEVLELFLGRSVAAVTAHYAGLGQALPLHFPADYAARVREVFSAALRPVAGVGAVLAALQAPSCVASSSDLARVALSLALTGLAAHFGDHVFTAQMVRDGKPAPDLFLLAAQRMGADPRRTLVIEDSVSGVQAGKAAGMTVWGFVGGSHYDGRDGHALLATAGADRVFAHMDDFWRAGETDGGKR